MTNGPVHNYLIWTTLLVGELMTPALGPVWTTGAQATGFIKRIIEHCYIQNIKAPGLMVSEKKIFVRFSYCKYMRATVPWGGAILNPRAS